MPDASLISASDLLPMGPRASFSFQQLFLESLAYEQIDATQDIGPIDTRGDLRVLDQVDTLDGSTTPSHLRCLDSPSLFPGDRAPVVGPCASAYRDVFGGDSPLSTPPSSRSSSPTPPLLRPASPVPPLSRPSSPARQNQARASKKRRNAKKSKRQRTELRRQGRAADIEATRTPKDDVEAKYLRPAQERRTEYAAKDIPSASTGYVAKRDIGDRVHTLEELLAQGFELIRWDGKTATPVTDSNGLVVAVLVGRPDDAGWGQVHKAAFDLLVETAPKLDLTPQCMEHRRGSFAAVNVGISFGGGQELPGNLSHSEARKDQLQALLDSNCFTRLAGFASSAFGTWMPKLHRKYSKCLDDLIEHDHELQRNFSNSVWAAAAFNFGPRTVTAKHRDAANYPFGICSITALGEYDATKGGHIVLWELGLVVEFPPGSTILIPSAAISHSNTPIGDDERRCSFTQFSAGGLFRWVDQGFRKQEKYFASLPKENRKHVINAANEARVAQGASLFSSLDELRGTKKPSRA